MPTGLKLYVQNGGTLISTFNTGLGGLKIHRARHRFSAQLTDLSGWKFWNSTRCRPA